MSIYLFFVFNKL